RRGGAPTGPGRNRRTPFASGEASPASPSATRPSDRGETNPSKSTSVSPWRPTRSLLSRGEAGLKPFKKVDKRPLHQLTQGLGLRCQRPGEQRSRVSLHKVPGDVERA